MMFCSLISCSRNVIRKLTSTKKYKLSDCKDLHLGSILKSLLEKGNRTTTVYMSISKELTACTMFITRSSQQVVETKSSDLTVLSVLKEFVMSFFLQRDCLFTAALFEELFKLNVPAIADLACKLPNYAFDPNVHPFRRSKAVEFLIIFWKNNRILQEMNEECSDQLRKMSKRLYKGCLKMIEDPVGRVQPKYILLLRRAFETIKHKKWLDDVDWLKFFLTLAEFQKVHASKSASKKEPKSNGLDKNGVSETNEENVTSATDLELESEAERDPENKSEYESKQNLSQENKNSVSKKKRKNESLEEDEKEELEQESEEEMDVGETESELEDSSNEKSLKKLEKKRSREKLKRTQLMKNTSKKLRLETMSAGLEENVFSQYNVLSNSSVSPER